MVKNVLRTKSLFILPLFFAFAMSSCLPATAQADAAVMPVGITAVCSNPNAGTAMWRIGNANPVPVTVSWDNGSVKAPYGYTTVTTDYSSDDDTATFMQVGQDDQTVGISDTACGEPVEGCVDGFDRSNLTFDWLSSGSVTVSTIDDAPLCTDVPLVFGAYTLPVTYSGSGIFDDSSVPQTKFSSTSAVMQAGTNGLLTLNTAVPNKCTDYQLDLYYAPEISTVSYHGHGAQLIYGDIYLHTAEAAACAVGGHGSEGQVLDAATTVAAPQVLADTGASTVLPIIGGLTLALSAIAITFSVPSKLKSLFAQK